MKINQYTYQELLLKKIQKLAICNISILKSYSSFFEKWRDTVFITNQLGCFIFFNEAAEKLTGYSRDDVAGRHFRLLFSLDDLNDGFLFFYQTMKGCYSEHTKFRIRCKNGSTKVVDVLAAPIMFDGKIRAALMMARDVTGQSSEDPAEKERARVFKEFNRDLERWDVENNRVREEVQKILQKYRSQGS